ncbi:hypothetical protein U15A_A00080 (plasmid) [Escherichia coli]|uniref:Uncharacterized protein n=1 Tax=Escherichia coli TaxID=562 RepID=A0A8F1IFE9_ECOLX|nr:hypothetical protein U15A_A00080 [Escherichia coli]QWP89414.1 hypothetical protein EOLPNHPH_00030 [Escherichia coli]WEG96329.1 hypothetical protein LFPDFDIP_00063 [Escherichia coli]GDU68479.1 hypothetical protein ExPUPEC61_04199 [Escherichia coli]GDW40393.1 hypothetical protein ExPUPEC119_04674 [Escherichia coli]
MRLRQKETARQEIEAVQGCRGEERSVGGETAHQPTEHRSRDHPEPETGAHEAEVPRALIAISDIGNISAGYRPSRPGDAGHDPPDIENPKERRRRHDGVVDSSAGQRDEQDRPPPETIRQRAQHRCAGKLHQRIQRQQNAIVGGDVVRVNQIAQEARQHRHNQADADSVERDSAQNYDQGSVGFHVWPPDQPPLVRLNARILYH